MNILKILKETNIWKNYPACKELKGENRMFSLCYLLKQLMIMSLDHPVVLSFCTIHFTCQWPISLSKNKDSETVKTKQQQPSQWKWKKSSSLSLSDFWRKQVGAIFITSVSSSTYHNLTLNLIMWLFKYIGWLVNTFFLWELLLHARITGIAKISFAVLMNFNFNFNPFCAGNAFMPMQTGWIQTSGRVTGRLAWDPTCLPLSLSFPIKNKKNL